MRTKISCCHNCSLRVAGCVCSTYLQEKKEFEEYRQIVAGEKYKERVFNSFKRRKKK